MGVAQVHPPRGGASVVLPQVRIVTFFANLILWSESTVDRYTSFRPFLPLWVNAKLLVKIPTGYRIRPVR